MQNKIFKVKINYNITIQDDMLVSAYLYVNYKNMKDKEAISFYPDGEIDFSNWAEEELSQPFKIAFIKWCDYISGKKFYPYELIKLYYKQLTSISTINSKKYVYR